MSYYGRPTPMVSRSLHDRKSEADPERWRMPSNSKNGVRQPCTMGWVLSRRTSGREHYFSTVDADGNLAVQQRAYADSLPVHADGLPSAAWAHTQPCPMCPDFLEAAAVEPEQRDAVLSVYAFIYRLGKSRRHQQRAIERIQAARAAAQAKIRYLDRLEAAISDVPLLGGLRTAYAYKDIGNAASYHPNDAEIHRIMTRWFGPDKRNAHDEEAEPV